MVSLLTTLRRTPAAPLALVLALTGSLAACGRRGGVASEGPRPAASLLPGAAGAAAGPAPDSAGVDYYSAAELARVAAELARGTGTGRTIGERTGLKYMEGRRVASGGVEVHDNWSDVVFVQAGRAELHAGGHVQGGRAEAGGEHRGGTIVGGSARPVAAGDFLVIPAGVPHQYQLAPGDSLVYLTIKALKP